MGKRTDAWNALGPTGKKASAAVIVAFAIWLTLAMVRASEPSACDDFRAVVGRVQAGDQHAESFETISDLRAVAEKALKDDDAAVVQAGSGLMITLDSMGEDPDAQDHLASQIRLLDESCR